MLATLTILWLAVLLVAVVVLLLLLLLGNSLGEARTSLWRRAKTSLGFAGLAVLPGVPLNGSGAVLARYVYAGSINVPALIVTSSASYRVVVDHLGSVRMVVNTSTGTIVERVDYTSFDDCMDDCSADSGVPQ